MQKALSKLYLTDQQLFHWINGISKKALFLAVMKQITHVGGATFTIGTSLILCIFTRDAVRHISIIAALSLLCSHLLVMVLKRSLPRLRPYLVLPQTIVIENPFKDYSFPSGHTTAIFSVTIPFIFTFQWLAIPLFSLAAIVGVSRIALGLHYPSDVLAGALLGTLSAGCILFFIG
ncbi:phosphatase PAP2 family protein [Halalkalibacter urbisdiaboli]|uniref:phosphatase PAP2 family protein n=1 Tax=Halalkalibacter urbisdiaboli TaxID=1960589 RepID=UPI000B43E5B8|nr:phosphatase PAP2 family protein [Halalkalibacter urbisdiaboli]